MALADRHLNLGRDEHSGEVLARGGDLEAHSILQRTGFVPVVRLHETYHRLPVGSQVAHLAEQIREATTSDEVSDVLTELTASHDGVLIALGEVLTAAASFYSDLGQAPDPHTAKRLQYLVEHRLGVIWSDLTHMRNDLADRHQNHPQRRTCAGEVGPDEREASAVCACPPPPPRLATSPVAPPAAPAPAARPRH
ncbi:hypothetical protein ACIQH7_10140 [Streptomyces anulatus]|uniref:hypothetical protein n=1 Tax=Streptomyces sp. NPDC088719 TaxID=3365872 RepID=UPI003822FAFC